MSFWRQFRGRRGPWVIIPLVAVFAAFWLHRSRSAYEQLSASETSLPSTEASSSVGLARFDLLQLVELNLFDWRVQIVKSRRQAVAPELALVALQDGTIERLRRGFPFGEPFGLLFDRSLYGRALRALSDEEVRLVAFDIVLTEERPDHPPVVLPDGSRVSSDAFFADQMRLSQRAVLASPLGSPPARLFRGAAHSLGAVDRTVDTDGVTRRVPAFLDHQLISLPLLGYCDRRGLEVRRVSARRLHLIDHLELETNSLPVNADGTVIVGIGRAGDSVTNFSKGRLQLPAFAPQRIWNMGIIMAAAHLGIDLEQARILPGWIELPRTNGPLVRLPVDRATNLVFDWSFTAFEVPSRNFEDVLANDRVRQSNGVTDLPNPWKNKLVLVGSTASGNNLTDRGATPLDARDNLVAIYLNVANSILQGRFVTRLPLATDLLIAVALAVLGGIVTWRARTSFAIVAIFVIGILYFAIAVVAYLQWLVWLPIAHPLVAGLTLSHVSILAYRTVFEQRERHRVRSVFARIVSPNIVQELLKAERLGLVGARRQITVFFADVRGFTEMTDRVQALAEDHVRVQGLSNHEAEAYFDAQSAELLATVNGYLAAIADVVKMHGGTLDKYIGDCVMAFWGAPTSNPRHAVDGVLAAIDAQRAVYKLNCVRATENQQREAINQQRVGRAERPLELLPLLALGTGINTGIVNVGLMGSDAHIVNYTVFGREVNLASRLEGVSGRSRIIIGEGTYQELLRHSPEVAALCRAQERVTVKGFRHAIAVYEVEWRTATGAAVPTSTSNPA